VSEINSARKRGKNGSDYAHGSARRMETRIDPEKGKAKKEGVKPTEVPGQLCQGEERRKTNFASAQRQGKESKGTKKKS